MRVTLKTNLKVGSTMHAAGETVDVPDDMLKGMDDAQKEALGVGGDVDDKASVTQVSKPGPTTATNAPASGAATAVHAPPSKVGPKTPLTSRGEKE